jgi:integrase
MPRKLHVPKYSHHKATGQAYVRLRDGAGGYNFVYLGIHGSAESREAYRKALAEYDVRMSGCEPTDGKDAPTVARVFVQFLKYAVDHYRRPDGEQTNEVVEYKALSILVNGFYSRTLATEFGPKALKAVRKAMIERGWCRNIINQRISRLKRVFKWAVAEELVPPSVYHGLDAVEGLKRNRGEARESEPVPPVSDEVIDATLPHLGRHVRGLVEFQRFTGCRPGEACAIRRTDIDMIDAVWLYRPHQHKGSWRGKERVIAIGPKAQDFLRPFFTKNLEDYLFSPRRAMQELRAERAAKRETPRYPSHMKRNSSKRKRKPHRAPAEKYNRISYFNAILRACDRAFPPPGDLAQHHDETLKQWNARLTEKQRAELKEWRAANRWAPNQLRHSHGTKVRKQFGLEAAQVALGHAKADVTQLYAERNLELAVKVAEKIG